MRHKCMWAGKLLLLTALIWVFAVPVWAQEDDEIAELLFEITGQVTFGENDELMVDGIIIAPASAFNPSILKEGDLVTVIGYLLNDDTLMAISLEFVDEEEEVEDVEDDEEAEEPEPELTPEATQAPDTAPLCGNPNHPLAVRIAAEFEITPEEVMAWHCQGIGFGNIARALLLARATGEDAQSYLDQHTSGQGWGKIMKESGVHPSQLAPGRAIGKKNKPSDDGDTSTESTVTNQRDRPGNSGGQGGGRPGNSGGQGNNNQGGGKPGNSGGKPGKP